LTRKQAPCFGPRRLKDEFELPCGLSAIARILRQSGLTRKKKRKFRKKRDLREIKAKYQPLTRFHMDVKYLTDIPNYVGQMNSPEYPSHQYTIRCLSTGATFLTFADGVSKTYATITVRRFLSHLKKFNIPLNEVVIQTDTGAEFTGPRGFTQAVEEEFGAHHRLVRRPNPNANADVESFHNTIEEEFYDLERFPAARSFWEKISTYSAYYNLARVNYSRGRKTPLELLQTARPDISPQVLLLPPVDVAKLLSLDCESERASQSEKCSLKRRRPRREEVGHHVPKLPVNGKVTVQSWESQRLGKPHFSGRSSWMGLIIIRVNGEYEQEGSGRGFVDLALLLTNRGRPCVDF
jgi:transposase InsO family protein